LTGYRVNLEAFAGPMDLLLYLVRTEEVDIYDIPITKITEQYLKYIEMLKNLNIDLAGDFLVMAATLMHIKSAMLLPKAQPDQIEAEDFQDPRAELIRQLLEYKKFKDAANLLDACAARQKQRTARPETIIDKLKDDNEPEVDMDNVSVWDLLEAFDTILQATGASYDISHIPDDTPIDLYQIEILHRLQTEGAMPFERIFEGKGNRLAMVGFFLAMLELIKDSLVAAEQQDVHSPIYVNALTDEPAEQAVQKTILAASAEQARQDEESQQISAEIPAQPVPIAELPEKKQTSEKTEPVQPSEQAVPIAEMAPKQKEKTAEKQPSQPEKNKTTTN